MTFLMAARMEDAAYAEDIEGALIGAGYYGGPGAYHVWPDGDWGLLPNYRLPIWVPSRGNKNGTDDGKAAVQALRQLGVPEAAYTAVDMEVMVDRTYVEAFWAVLRAAGYRLWVYGSRSTVFRNPQCNGWWVADYGLTTAEVMALLAVPGVRAVQYAANLAPGYYASLVREWTEGGMWHG